MPVREKRPRSAGSCPARPFSRPSHTQTAAKLRGFSQTAQGFTTETDSPLEGDGFEPSVPRQRSRNFLAFYVPAVIGQRPDSFGSREKTHIARIRAVSPSRWDREKPLPSIGESPTNRGAAGELTLSQGVCEPPGRRNWRNPFGEGMASDVQ